MRSGTGHDTRHTLLAKAFAHPPQGRQEMYDFTDTSDEAIADHQALERAADGISATVESLDASRLRRAQVDEGAMYLATTAAIFYV